jgi:hypothetical protein
MKKEKRTCGMPRKSVGKLNAAADHSPRRQLFGYDVCRYITLSSNIIREK